MRYLLDNDFPTLGLCYGLQMLALASGTALTGLTAEDLQAVEVTLTEEGRQDSVTGKLPPVIRAYTGHADSLAGVPSGATLLASGEHCKCQIVRFGKKHLRHPISPRNNYCGNENPHRPNTGTPIMEASEKQEVIIALHDSRCNQLPPALSAFTEHYQR
mgnify:CR=1 FL=1